MYNKMTINVTFNFKPTAITFKTKNNLFNNIPFILSIAISIVSMQSHATDMTDVNSLISQAVQTHFSWFSKSREECNS